MSRVISPLPFWLYLWGIETITHKHNLQASVDYFDSTYEELKHLICKITHCYTPFILTLPMRNWNALAGQVTKISLRNFDSTYEELKHAIAEIYHINFISILTLPMRNWNNSKKPSFFVIILIILTLPMRNWNYTQNFPSFSSLLILTLPMRNWNSADE